MRGPPAHTRWQKGQSGNPGGRPALPPGLKAIRELSAEEIKRLFAKYARMTERELRALLNPDNPDSQDVPMIERAIAAIITRSATTGEFAQLEFVLNRTIGKPKEADETSEEQKLREELRLLSDEELAERARQVMPSLRKAE